MEPTKDNAPMDEQAKADFATEVNTTVEACLAEDYATKEEYVDALIGKLEALKGEPEMGGLGEDADNGMSLPADEVPGEEE